MDPNSMPSQYQDILERVNEIEQRLSRLYGLDDLAEREEDHSDSDKAEQEDELQTDKIAPVVVKSTAYMKMAIHSKKYANKWISKEEWVEVIGLLTGNILNEDTPLEQIIVNDYWPIGHGDAVSVQIMDSGSFTKVINEVPRGDFIVGWAHSHPSYGNFLSIDDYNTQNRYQTLWSKAIALVIDPTQISKSNYGFAVFRNTHKEPGSKGYTSLSFEVDGMSPPASNDVLKLIQPAFEGNELKFLEYE